MTTEINKLIGFCTRVENKNKDKFKSKIREFLTEYEKMKLVERLKLGKLRKAQQK